MTQPTTETGKEMTSAQFEGMRDSSSLMSQEGMLRGLEAWKQNLTFNIVCVLFSRVKAKNCELLNRPALGISELASSLHSFHTNITEGVKIGMYGEGFFKKLLNVQSTRFSCL